MVVLNVLMSLSAVVLGVTLYAITRGQDSDLALLGLVCRIVEGVTGATGIPQTLGLLWLATASGAQAPDPEAVPALGALFLRDSPGVAAIFFASGSTLFAWLLLRGRMIPVGLARLGVGASVLLVVILPLQLSGLLLGPWNWLGLLTWLVWLPMLVFEVALALWLLTNGVAPPANR